MVLRQQSLFLFNISIATAWISGLINLYGLRTASVGWISFLILSNLIIFSNFIYKKYYFNFFLILFSYLIAYYIFRNAGANIYGFLLFIIPFLIYLVFLPFLGEVRVRDIAPYARLWIVLYIPLYFYIAYQKNTFYQAGFAAQSTTVLLLTTIMINDLIWNKKSSNYPFILLAFAIFTLSLSRINIILVLIIFMINFLYSNRTLGFIIITILCIFLVSFDVHVLAMQVFFIENPSSTDVTTWKIQSSGRIFVWSEILASTSHPIWYGNGFGAASSAGKAISEHFTHPHNDYLRLYFDFGIIGLSILIVVLFKLLRSSKNLPQPEYMCILSLIIALLGLMATDNILMYASFFGIPFVLLICMFKRRNFD